MVHREEPVKNTEIYLSSRLGEVIGAGDPRPNKLVRLYYKAKISKKRK
jgi:hypothetical protein